MSSRGGPKPKSLAERFWPKVRKSDGCWEWTAHRSGHGYGYIMARHKAGWRPLHAHRASWEINRGPIPDGLHVLHRCDNPPCVNPDHLFLGTHLENVADMHAKGRHRSRSPKGEASPNAKLTGAAVMEIRAAWVAGVSGAELSRRFRVSRTAIGCVVKRRSWKHLEEQHE